MVQEIVVLGDGSTLLLNGLDRAPSDTSTPAEEGTLSTVHEVQGFVAEAIAAGITFDLLKTLVLSLARGGRLTRRQAATADEVRVTLTRHFHNAGYDDIDITEIRKVDGQGWTGKGNVDGRPFRALSDEAAHVVHVRIE